MQDLLRNSTKMGLLFIFLAASSAHALFDVQAVIGYAGLSYVDDGAPTASNKFKDTSLQALTLGLSAHIHASEPNVICVGIGPFLMSGPGSNYTSEASGANVSFSGGQLMIGGEVYGKILAGAVVLPYIKIGYAADRNWTQVQLGASSAETKLVGSGYRFLLGIEIVLAPSIGIIFEGGSVGSTYTVSGSNISGEKAKGGAYILNTGISVSF